MVQKWLYLLLIMKLILPLTIFCQNIPVDELSAKIEYPFTFDSHILENLCRIDSVFTRSGNSMALYGVSQYYYDSTNGSKAMWQSAASHPLSGNYAIANYLYLLGAPIFYIEHFTYDTEETFTFRNTLRDECHYSNGMRVDSIRSLYTDSSDFHSKKVFTYTNGNQLISETLFGRQNGMWIPFERELRTYDTLDRLEKKSFQFYDQGYWKETSQIRYFYNQASQVTYSVRYKVVNSQIIPEQQIEYYYTGSAALPDSLYSSLYQNSQWALSAKTIYTYTSNSILQSIHRYTWKPQWQLTEVIKRTYESPDYYQIIAPDHNHILHKGQLVHIGLPNNMTYFNHFIFEFSPDGGTSWQNISNSIFFLMPGIFTWQVPNQSTSRGKLRVRNTYLPWTTETTGFLSILDWMAGTGDIEDINIGRLKMPITRSGVLADATINGVSGGRYDESNILFSGGFFLSGYANDTYWVNANATASRFEDYTPGRINENPIATANRIYVVKRTDPDFGQSWNDWLYAVQRGAAFYDGNNDGFYTPIDLNQNGKWDPTEDKPDLLGDMTAFTTYNDGNPSSERRFTTMSPMGIEINQTVFGYKEDQQHPEIGNTVFVRYTLENKGTVAAILDSVLFSPWMDADLGDYTDDLVGTDTLYRVGYVYNEGTDTQYGSNPPALGISIVQGPQVYLPGITFSDVNSNGLYDEGIDIPLMWAPRLSSAGKLDSIPGAMRFNNLVASQHYMSSHPTHGDPGAFPEQIRYYQKGLRSNGEKIDPCTWPYGQVAGIPCNTVNPIFIYSGDPVQSSGWKNNTSTDQRQLITAAPFSLTVGTPVDIIVGYTGGRGNSHLASITAMRSNIQKAQEAFHNLFPVITGIDDNTMQPLSFTLEQNYPNPFNPATRIRFTIDAGAITKLTVYNILGEEVARIVDREMSPGQYEYVFHASHLPSGIYLIRLQSGSNTATVKSILLK